MADGDGLVDVAADAEHSVVGEDDRPQVAEVLDDALGEGGAPRQLVGAEGDLATEDRHLLVDDRRHPAADHRERGDRDAVGVDDRAHALAAGAMDRGVHEQLAGGVAEALDHITGAEVDDAHVGGGEQVVAHAARRGGDELGAGDADGDVARGAGDQPEPDQLVARPHHLLALLVVCHPTPPPA